MKKLLLIVTLSVVLFGMASISNATSVIGVYCFQMDSFGDTWVWTVEGVGSVYQVTGQELANGTCAMNGGGQIINNHLIMTVDEVCTHGIQGGLAVDLDLATLTGTTDLVWHNPDGTVGPNYVDLTFHNIACPVAAADANNGLPTTSGK